jgi:hypothetical protein
VQESFNSESSPEQVVGFAMQAVTRAGGTITSNGPGMVAADFTLRGSCLVTAILALFFILPAVVYWLWAKRAYKFLVQASQAPDGQTLVTLTTSGGPADEAGEDFLALFHGDAAAGRIGSGRVLGPVDKSGWAYKFGQLIGRLKRKSQ